MYCKYCGEQLPEGSGFCPSCGNQLDGGHSGIKSKSNILPSEEVTTEKPRFVKRSELEHSRVKVGDYTYTKSSGTNWLPICIGVIIIVIIGFAVLVAAIALMFIPFAAQYSEPRLLDTTEFGLSTNGTINGLNLDLYNSVGTITIDADYSFPSNYIYIQQQVWTSKSNVIYDVSQRAGFHETATAENITTIFFDSNEGHGDYYYELYIVVRPDIPLKLDVNSVAGLITFSSVEEITLTGLDVRTSAGSITFVFQETVFLNFTTGYINSSAGTIFMSATNFNMSQDCALYTEASVGSITLEMNQTIDSGHTLDINAATSLGKIEANVNYGVSIGVSLITDTEASDVSISGLVDGFTTNYATTTTHLDFALETSLGEIQFIAVNI